MLNTDWASMRIEKRKDNWVKELIGNQVIRKQRHI